MTPAPVAAAKSINIAAEGEYLMTGEELETIIQDVSEKIDNLPESKEPLSKEEKKYREGLLFRKKILLSIKEAKEKDQKEAEVYGTIGYNLFTSWGERHPFLMGLVMNIIKSRMRGSVF